MDSTQLYIEKEKTIQRNFTERPLIELTNFCNDKGFEVIPEKKGSHFVGLLFLNGEFVKEGVKDYPDQVSVQKDIYNQIFKKLNRL